MSMAIAVCIGAWAALAVSAGLVALIQWDAKRRAKH